MALYRQGRIPGSVYTGLGQEAVAAAAGLALGPDDVVAPLNREHACHYARGVTVGGRPAQLPRTGDRADRGATATCISASPNASVFPLVSMLGDLVPGHRRRGARVQAPRRAARGADVPRRRRLLGRRRARGAQPGGRAGGCRRSSWSEEPVAYSTPTGSRWSTPTWRSGSSGGWSIPCARVDGTDAIATSRDPRCGRAGARRRGPAGDRGGDAARPRTRGARRRGATSRRAARRTDRDPVERLAARLRARRARPTRSRGASAAAAEVAAGLAEAEAAPAPDPATLEDGVYASPLRAVRR